MSQRLNQTLRQKKGITYVHAFHASQLASDGV
jgi:hypothetical protein